MTRNCRRCTCGCFLPAKPTRYDSEIVSDYAEFGDPGNEYEVYPVEVLVEREYVKCSHCWDETLVGETRKAR